MENFIAPLHRAGWSFIAAFAIITVILAAFSSILGFLGILLTGWCAYFFRHPRRVTPLGEGLIISPADGIVCQIEKVDFPKELAPSKKEKGKFTRVSVFLNVFDVHVNRIPIDGEIEKIHYIPGKFLNASLDKASEFNERNLVLVKAKSGHEILVVQIAGLIARRILWDIRPGQKVKAGETFGIIRFGSRVDVYLPHGVNPQVVIGQRMVGGETVLADLGSTAPQRKGESRP
jgi:phosphatidylserine decarboxylase